MQSTLSGICEWLLDGLKSTSAFLGTMVLLYVPWKHWYTKLHPSPLFCHKVYGGRRGGTVVLNYSHQLDN
eukprot:scaffold6870_cov121-Cylindrotheca_fusiformis.AAC.2